MIKRFGSTCLMLSMASLAHAGLPLSLSAPSPAIDGTLYAGSGSSSYTYTIYNRTNRNIPVSQSITGNSTSVAITTPCTVVPAAGSCNFVVSAQPSVQDYLLSGGIQDNVVVSYSGRLPSQITAAIATSIAIPIVTNLNITSSVASSSNNTLAGGYVTYAATAQTAAGVVLDLTPIVTWSSSDTTVASAPNTQGQAFTYPPAGASSGARTATVTATYVSGGTTLSNTSPTLSVYHNFYVATPVGPNNTSPSSPMLSTDFDSSGVGTTDFTPINPTQTTSAYTRILGIAINSDARYIYMSNQTGTIYSCPLTASTGQFGAPETCSQITIATGTGNNIATIRISPNNKFLYALTANGLYACQVAQATGALSGCVLQTTNLANGNIRAFAVDPNGLYMYVIAKANLSPYMQTCSINQSTGRISNCIAQAPVGISATYTTDDITAVSTANGTYIYGSAFILGGPNDGMVLTCQATTTTGTVNSCSYTAIRGITSNPTGVAVSQTSSGVLQIYSAQGQNGRVYNCTIGSDYVTFSSCGSVSTGRNNAGVVVR